MPPRRVPPHLPLGIEADIADVQLPLHPGDSTPPQAPPTPPAAEPKAATRSGRRGVKADVPGDDWSWDRTREAMGLE